MRMRRWAEEGGTYRLPPSLKDGNRSSVLYFIEYRTMENSRNPLILSVIRHCQNPLESNRRSSLTKKFKVTLGRLCLPYFGIHREVLLAYFQKRGENVNSASYCEVLLKLRDAIRRKQPGQLAGSVLLRHDSGLSYTAVTTQGRIE
jgi:hypothetical protein